jgi:NADPH-dependent curcumin reductase CurA
MTLAREIRVVRRPSGALRAEDLALVSVDLPDPADGEVQVAAVLVSVDPYLRLSMDVDQPVGGVLFGGGIGRVVATRSP